MSTQEAEGGRTLSEHLMTATDFHERTNASVAESAAWMATFWATMIPEDVLALVTWIAARPDWEEA